MGWRVGCAGGGGGGGAQLLLLLLQVIVAWVDTTAGEFGGDRPLPADQVCPPAP